MSISDYGKLEETEGVLSTRKANAYRVSGEFIGTRECRRDVSLLIGGRLADAKHIPEASYYQFSQEVAYSVWPDHPNSHMSLEFYLTDAIFYLEFSIRKKILGMERASNLPRSGFVQGALQALFNTRLPEFG